MRTLIKSCTIALLLATPQLAMADLYGLVVGVNDYQHYDKLEGAVNDANDVADALERLRAKKVIKLLDRKASRDAIMKGWNEITKEAKPGDTIIFSYAGHGSQSKERVAGSETDSKDEFYLLADFASKGPGSKERILDDDIAAMIKAVPELHVMLVSDSCHSGTMTRGIEATRLKYRQVPPQNIVEDALPPSEQGPVDEAAAMSDVVSFSGVPDHEKVPEVTIDDKQRGALSWSLSNGLRGAADLNKDNEITQQELEQYVRENVRTATDGIQHPQVRTREGVPLHLALGKGKGEAKAEAKVDSGKSSFADIKPAEITLVYRPAGSKVGTRGFQRSSPSSSAETSVTSAAPPSGPVIVPTEMAQLKGIKVVTANEQGAWTLDMNDSHLISPLGDVYYDLPVAGNDNSTRGFTRSAPDEKPKTTAGGLPVEELGRVFDKVKLVERIKKLSQGSGMVLALKPDDRRYTKGERVTVTINKLKYPYFTFFNLGSDGTVNYLYPRQEGGFKDSLKVATDKPYELALDVTPPFGADHFVAIASKAPLEGLQRELANLDGSPKAEQVAKLLEKHLTPGQEYQIGVHGVFTGPK